MSRATVMRRTLYERVAACRGSLLAHSPLCVLLQHALDLCLHHHLYSERCALNLPVLYSAPQCRFVLSSEQSPGWGVLSALRTSTDFSASA